MINALKKLLQHCHAIHTWGQWEDRIARYSRGGQGQAEREVQIQVRECQVCGKKELSKIRDTSERM